MTEEWKRCWAALEPAAQGDNETRPMMSIAISLRRIADALTGDGENVLNRPLNAYGENIGECIEGQFNRSGR